MSTPAILEPAMGNSKSTKLLVDIMDYEALKQ